MRLNFEWLIVALITVLVIISLIIFVPSNLNKLAKSFIGLSDNSASIDSSVSSRSDIFDAFSREVKSCLESPDTFCYCQLSNTFIPNNNVLEFENVNGELHLSFYKDISLSDCSILENSVAVKEDKFPGFIFYVEDSYGLPSVDKSLKAISSGFTAGTVGYISGSNFCSNKDVKGSDSIDFKDGVLYKPYRILGGDRSSSGILLTRKQDGLRPCGIGSSSPVGSIPVSVPNFQKDNLFIAPR